MASEGDEFNADLFKFFEETAEIYPVKIFFENKKLGKYGRHIFFNELVKKATGDWILHTCDDQRFTMDEWDLYLRNYIIKEKIDSSKIHIINPLFNNTGWVDQMVSKPYLNVLGRLGGYGNIDSWFGNIMENLKETDRVHVTPDSLMTDLTLYPEIYTPEYMQGDISEGVKLPRWDTPNVQDDLKSEIEKLKGALQNGL